MPRHPNLSEPFHPVQQFDRRVGVLHGDAANVVGHVFVESRVYWQHAGGWLWFSRWANPEQTVIAQVYVDDQYEEWFLGEDDLAAEVENWTSGRFAWTGNDHIPRVFEVTWLSPEESILKAQSELKIDTRAMPKARRST